MKAIKKALCIILALISIISLNACGGNKGEDASKNDDVSIQKSGYAISEDLEILAEYLKVSNSGFGKHFFTFVKNNSDDTIIDYTIAYIGFDMNGNVTDANTGGYRQYGKQKTTMANILPGNVHGLADGSTEGIYVGDSDAVRYVKSAVSYIKFKSGEEWEMGDMDAWAEDTIKNFSVEEQKNYAQSLKADAEKAMNNPYLTIFNSNTTPSNNSLIDALDLTTTFKNTGDKPIRSFKLIVLEFEEGNKGVTLPNQTWTWNYQYITNNSRQITADFPLEPQQEIESVAESALVSYCKDYLIIVEYIEFEDDTVWYNDYALQFMMYNEKEKLL